MSKRKSRTPSGAMLDLWRPPTGSGEAVGCLATTYTFAPGLFDEHCLAHFLEVDSEPNREDLAFLLEREIRLGGTYAGILVDHTQSGVSHSLRWDVLPVRIRGGKQHSKISLLVWTNHIRIIVASANLTEPGYRTNQEIAFTLDMTPESFVSQHLADTCDFLRCLLAFVPGANPDVPEIGRAIRFIHQAEEQARGWKPAEPMKNLSQHLVFTLPSRDRNAAVDGPGFPERRSLSEAIRQCRNKGRSPTAHAVVASPFFDEDDETDATTSALCKSMTRETRRQLTFCLPSIGEKEHEAIRLAAPESLLRTPKKYTAAASFKILPKFDGSKNLRPWHAKMLALGNDQYSALMVGSSNFTRAGMGIGRRRNAEANLLTIAERRSHAREPGQLESIWPEMSSIDRPESAEWQGPKPDEEQCAQAPDLPMGFLSAHYRAGDVREIVLRLDRNHLPDRWSVNAADHPSALLIDHEGWIHRGRPQRITLSWKPLQPPSLLLVRWPDGEAYWSLNIEDARQLPPPVELEKMSAEEMLEILAASDPGAASRAWAKKEQNDHLFDEELDAAIPPDLDPLHRYNLKTTFLRRIRSRARMLAKLRANLQRPVWSDQALQWRLGGFIGITPLAKRLLKNVIESDGHIDEELLALADFLIVLREIEYSGEQEGSLAKTRFYEIFEPFLKDLVTDLDTQIQTDRKRIGKDVLDFWNRMVKRCQQ